jgi:hypothetical protein
MKTEHHFKYKGRPFRTSFVDFNNQVGSEFLQGIAGLF